LASIFINVTHGPEHPTRACLGFLVARYALEQGHQVSMFLAGDAVQLIRDDVLDSLSGLGTGSLREHFDIIAEKGGKIYLSKMSSKTRGVTPADVEGKPTEMVMPADLVRLALEHERNFTY
jgi:predicted peroxiredoxin